MEISPQEGKFPITGYVRTSTFVDEKVWTIYGDRNISEEFDNVPGEGLSAQPL